MEAKDYWRLHDIYFQIAEYYDVDIEATEYHEHGVFPNYVHKEVKDHREAIRLLSGVLEEETDLPVTSLETWERDYEKSQWPSTYQQTYRDLSCSDDNPAGK